eukprot:scaffold100729_cov37-Tisochrysis_lutea.AAC.2
MTKTTLRSAEQSANVEGTTQPLLRLENRARCRRAIGRAGLKHSIHLRTSWKGAALAFTLEAISVPQRLLALWRGHGKVDESVTKLLPGSNIAYGAYTKRGTLPGQYTIRRARVIQQRRHWMACCTDHRV